MYKTTTLGNAPILLPNREHKNFTDSGEFIPMGMEIVGDNKVVNGLRRGKPFDYKVFITNDGQIIYSKYVKPMATEVTMGADAQVSATKVEMISGEKKITTRRVVGAVVGGVVGYAISKRGGVKRSFTQQMLFIGGGALAGYMVGNYFNKKTGIVVEKAK
jgi:hypothetical protein